MKRNFAFLPSIFGLALVAGLSFLHSSLKAENQHHEHKHAQMHQHDEDAKSNKKVRCAVDGMMMKASAMMEMSHDGKTYYFCNAKQAKMFMAHPDKYLKQISFGPLTLNFNLVTIDEYKEMMREMGMGGMMKMDVMKGKTHRLSVYMTQRRDGIALEGISFALQITDANGKETTVPLTYNKMMKAFDAFAAVPSGGKYRIRVLIATPEINISQ